MICFLKRLLGFREPPFLAFKSGRDAFDYCCEFMSNEIAVGRPVMGIVLDGRHLGSNEAITVNPDDTQQCFIAVASSDGGFPVLTQTSGPRGPLLRPGDLVLWTPVAYHEMPSELQADQRCGWVGFVHGTLRPEWRGGMWRGDRRFLPR